jgi:subtilisin family serine protease
MRSLLTAVAALPLVLAAPLLSRRGANVVPDKYIVVMKKGGTHSASTFHTLGGGAIKDVQMDHKYEIGTFKGFAATLSNSQLKALQSDKNVAYIEPVGFAHISVPPTKQDDADDEDDDEDDEDDEDDKNKKGTEGVTETGAPWGLGRISHREKGISDYVYDSSAGDGSCVYIVDTGIFAAHAEFEGRATFLKNLANGSTATSDDNGHGTHCAGTIGSKTFGVSKKAKLFGVKVLDGDGSGSWDDVVAGINFAAKDAQTRGCAGNVISMSLGGEKMQSVNDAAAAAVDAGIFVAVAAGNEGQDYTNTSPASEPKVMAVGASDVNDNLADFSNYGKDLGVIAPGVDVNSTWNTQGGFNVISGTSMATPHVAGLAAYLLALNGALKPADVKAKIRSLATPGKITLSAAAAGSANYLAFNGWGA